MSGEAGKTGVNPWAVLGWIFDALGACALAFCVWMATEIAELKEWRAETSGNRWNSQMQADYASKQAQELTRIWSEMASMKTEWLKQMSDVNIKLAQLPSTLQLPPKWWEDYVKSNLADHNGRLKALEKAQTNRSNQ